MRSFGLVMLASLGALALIAHRRHQGPAVVLGLALAGALLALAGLAAPAALRPVYRAWMALGHALGRVTTPVALAAVFVGVFVPLRLLMGLLRRDPLGMRPDRAAKTYWSERPRRAFDRGDFERLS